MTIAERWSQIQSQIKKPITLVGVTKFQPIENIRAAIECGLRHLGVNYAQAGLELQEAFTGHSELQWHFIGHIQSRKAKQLISYDQIESVDRLEIAKTLSERSTRGRKSILIQINIGEEAQKSGVLPAEAESFFRSVIELPGISVDGLMAMPPFIALEQRRKYFTEMSRIFEKLAKVHPLKTLSMGTSEDYLVAIEEGANQIRLGSSLFGERAPH